MPSPESRRRLRAAALAVLAAVVAPGALVARPAPSPAAAPEVQEGWNTVAGEVLCWCGCARQSLRDCTCGESFDIRQQIETRLASGEKPEAIIASLVNEHGEQILVVPKRQGFNALAWVLPGACIALGAAFVFLVLRRWSRPPAPGPVPVPPPRDEAAEARLRSRLERDLGRVDF